MSLLFVLALGMFIQRDGVNLVKYHSAVPDCGIVLSIKECSAYSSWSYNYYSHQQVLSGATPPVYNFKVYTKQWFYWMWYRLFFAVNGAASNFISYPPLPQPREAAGVVALASVLAIIWWRKKLFRGRPYIVFILGVCVIYSAVLFAKGYATYKYTAVLENMNGRYLVPILPLLAAVAGLALSFALKRWRTQKVLAAVIILILFLQGGGLLNFIMRSDETWYWPNPAVTKVNNAARKITQPVIIKNQKVPSSNIAPRIVN